MQSNIIKAFRQRLVRAGFTNISIYDNFDGTFDVSCIKGDQYFHYPRYSLEKILITPRVVWFD